MTIRNPATGDIAGTPTPTGALKSNALSRKVSRGRYRRPGKKRGLQTFVWVNPQPIFRISTHPGRLWSPATEPHCSRETISGRSTSLATASARSYFACMHDTDLYKKFLGIDNPWFISQVTVDDATLTIEVLVEFRGEPSCPRVQCAEHGVMQIDAPWVDRGSHFTALFECVVIDWLRLIFPCYS